MGVGGFGAGINRPYSTALRINRRNFLIVLASLANAGRPPGPATNRSAGAPARPSTGTGTTLQVENIFRDNKHDAALGHLPSGYPQVNRA